MTILFRTILTYNFDKLLKLCSLFKIIEWMDRNSMTVYYCVLPEQIFGSFKMNRTAQFVMYYIFTLF